MKGSKVLTLMVITMALLVFSGCGGGSGTGIGSGSGGPVATVTAPASVTGGQAGYAASVALQSGSTYSWSITNGTIMVGEHDNSIAFTPGGSGTVTVTCKVTSPSGVSATGTASAAIVAAPVPPYNITQALTDGAQGTTIAFSGFAMMTGNLGAQSFFPPGKVADYWGFQYLRDNDADNMGHNTSFLTRVSSNMLFILNDAQIAALKDLAASQVNNINLYAWKRYPLMTAFRRLMDGTIPALTTGLSLSAVQQASRDLYLLDGQISYERAVVYGEIFRSLTAAQKSYIGAMVGKGYNSWPDKKESDVADKTRGLTHDEVVAMMTYAGDLYSWYAGSIAADVYFCPERHGTYYGAFFVKDAPAVGHPGYSIDEQMTATIGRALIDTKVTFTASGGVPMPYISASGAALMNSLTAAQKKNMSDDPVKNIVLARQKISEALRSLIRSTAPSAAELAAVQATVSTWSGTYGDLDGENNYNYATTFAKVFNNVGGAYLNAEQKGALDKLRTDYMTVTWLGVTTDYSKMSTPYLFSAPVSTSSATYISSTSDTATDPLFE